jgi:hypothetical protein
VCVPSPAPYAMCVRQAGVIACPAGYPAQHVVGTDVIDGRGCTPCTCGFDAGSCAGTATFYTGAMCNASNQTVNVDGGCQAVSNQTFKTVTYAATQVAASCTPSTTQPTGDASLDNVATVCCAQ